MKETEGNKYAKAIELETPEYSAESRRLQYERPNIPRWGKANSRLDDVNIVQAGVLSESMKLILNSMSFIFRLQEKTVLQ